MNPQNWCADPLKTLNTLLTLVQVIFSLSHFQGCNFLLNPMKSFILHLCKNRLYNVHWIFMDNFKVLFLIQNTYDFKRYSWSKHKIWNKQDRFECKAISLNANFTLGLQSIANSFWGGIQLFFKKSIILKLYW